ncbi:hypothetical protein [uncultured Microbulbifer sp.]|uniref:hypothetical protein n=1 Tax=uncultured Microbulbifer sp. TaxID=348147 RepID=UPI00261973BD|nr:hypothetical protein [uncultured Microbulbifer sp.]
MANDNVEKSLEESVKLLNALGTGYHDWKSTIARNFHVDEFGKEITPGEAYYCIESGGSANSYRRLKHSSMSKFLEVMFDSSPGLLQLAEELKVEREEKLKSEMEAAARTVAEAKSRRELKE